MHLQVLIVPAYIAVILRPIHRVSIKIDVDGEIKIFLSYLKSMIAGYNDIIAPLVEFKYFASAKTLVII